MGNYIAGGLVGLLIVYALYQVISKKGHGCCGGSCSCHHDSPKHHHKQQQETFPHTTLVKIDGIACGGCGSTIDYALNQLEGVRASTNHMEKVATIHSKKPLDEAKIRQTIEACGPYRVTEFIVK